MPVSRLLFALLIPLLLAACQDQQVRDGEVPARGFQMSDVAKGDVDLVAEVHVRQSMDYLHELMGKLYRRNPGEWRRAGHDSVEAAVDWAFMPGRVGKLKALNGQRSVEAIRLAFDDGFEGDRVLAFVYGLRSMLLDAYNGKEVFYLTDSLDPQKLYNAARNIEVAVWKLSHDRRADGSLFLLSNGVESGVPNLSYERLFGKLIVLQDSMAMVIADKDNRTIKNVIQGVAQMVFLPI